MFAAQRRALIIELVRGAGAMSLRELSRTLKCSEVTVRRDLRVLEAEGLLSRRHGGAVAPGGLAHEPTYTEKSHVAGEAKESIADVAAGLVREGDAIIIGAGTTAHAFARKLVRLRDLTVVTNSLLVAQTLARARGIEVIVSGGTLRGSILALVGGAAEHALAGIRASMAFLSGNGVTAARGVSTPNPAVASLDRTAAAAAERVVVLADHTKIGVETMIQTIPPPQIDVLVTDEAADPDELDGLRQQGVEVLIAHPVGE